MTIAVAIYAADPAARERLAVLAGSAGARIAGSADDPASLARLLSRETVPVVITALSVATDLDPWLGDRGAAYVVIVADGDRDTARAALDAGAISVLPHNTDADALRLAIEGATRELSVVARSLRDDDRALPNPSERPLTPRELDVLAALADGASNKMIARRLGISFHTVKFHVASILEKLDAESRTEALAEAARRGLVML